MLAKLNIFSHVIAKLRKAKLKQSRKLQLRTGLPHVRFVNSRPLAMTSRQVFRQFAKHCIFFASLLGIQTFAYAVPDPEFDYCTNDGFSFYNGSLILNSDNQSISRIFQIQNIEGGKVTLNREMENNPGMNAGWTSSIDGGQYSLLAMNQRGFAFRCLVNNPPYEIGLANCQRVLKVCAITPKQPLGSFWISENKSLSETLRQLKSRRIFE